MVMNSISSNLNSSQPRIAQKGEIDLVKGIEKEFLPLGINQGAADSFVFPKEKVEEMVKNLNLFIKDSPTSLKFEYHEKLNEYYVTIVDDVTHEVVREIPPKKMLDFYAAMTEFLGILMDKKV